jgi:hypothetical protein
VYLVALLIVVASSLALLAQNGTENVGMVVTRSISAAHALPESTFQVTLELKVDVDLDGVGLREVLPIGWMIHPVENAGAAFKRSEGEWVFNEAIEAGATLYVTYEVTIPPSGQLMSNPLPQCFSINGTYQATVPSFEIAIQGESTIEIVSDLPIGTAIAHLIPAPLGGVDTIDLRLSRTISALQLQRALELWQHDLVVPNTGGERIDLAMMNHLAAQFETCTRADDALPLSIDPELEAIRTLETFLPCDSVLLPEGCLDPGQSAREITVRVRITPSFDAYGVGLKEWFPSAWRVTPIKHDGFWYRPSASEWVYPARVRTGETLEVVYQVEVVSMGSDSVELSARCCGQEMLIVGEAFSALECSTSAVLGENTVTVGPCIPVILAISRWDVEEDRLDVRLSDNITFPQLQRAVQFWAQDLPVPHTCGYTVGYHTLKSLVTYWLSGFPVTGPLPLPHEGLLPVCGDSIDDCLTASCIEGWLCQLAEMQDPADFVGLPEPPTVEVDGGPDRVLNCAQPSVTLTATTSGGVDPFKYEWIGPSGQTIGQSKTINIDMSGDYTVIVISCGGCRATDTVSVIGDFAQPSVQVSVSDVLTGYVEIVDLTAIISGGTGPFAIVWETPSGASIVDMLTLSVDQPGVYLITVTGANGCSATTEALVLQDIEPPLVEIEIAPIPSISLDAVLTCAISEILLTSYVAEGREPYVLAWTDSRGTDLGSTPVLVVDAPGTYSLTATGANGCSASTSVNVIQDIEPPVVTTTAGGELTCLVAEVVLTTSVVGGRPPLTYQWIDAAGEVVGSSTEFVATAPGSYIVTVTGANGCSDSVEVVVHENIEPPVVSATVDGILTCALPDVSLTAIATGGRAPYGFLWINAAGSVVGDTETVTVSAPGTYTVVAVGGNGCSAEAVVTVVQDIELPVVDATVDGVLTCAVTEVNLHANVVGGRSPLVFEWTNEAQQVVGSDVLLRVSIPGVYTVCVTGANGCFSSAHVIVEEDIEPPSVSVGVEDVLTCAVTEVHLTSTVSEGRSPYSYSWVDAAGNIVGQSDTLVVSTPGEFSVTVTGANGCQASASVTVQQDIESPNVVASVGGKLTCAVTEILLTSVVSGGRSPYLYEWTDEAGQILGCEPDVVVSEPGIYFIIVTGANGCASSAVVEVLRDIAPPFVSIGVEDVLTCAVTEVHLTSSVSGGRSPYSYSWVDAAGNVVGQSDTLVVSTPGEYSVTVTGANGCQANASVTVQQDIEPPNVAAYTCCELTCTVTEILLTSVVSGGRSPYLYEWTNEAGQILGCEPNIVVSEPGIYFITVTGANGCASSAVVEVQQDIAPPSVSVGEDRTLTCAEPEITVDAVVCGGRAPFSYLWTDDCGIVIATTEDITLNFVGTYTLTVTGANGCASSDTLELLDGINPPLVDAGPDQIMACLGDEVLLDATVTGGVRPYEFTWVDSCNEVVGQCEDLVVSLPGVYILTVRSADGCVAVDSATVELP